MRRAVVVSVPLGSLILSESLTSPRLPKPNLPWGVQEQEQEQ